MIRLSKNQFDKIVQEALDRLPEPFAVHLENVMVIVEDEPDTELLESLDMDPEEDTLFGFYQGVPLDERSFFHGNEMPDVIYIFKGPHEREFNSRQDMIEEIIKTVLHEIAHHFGMTEEQLKRRDFG